jgi:hypothetical protein
MEHRLDTVRTPGDQVQVLERGCRDGGNLSPRLHRFWTRAASAAEALVRRVVPELVLENAERQGLEIRFAPWCIHALSEPPLQRSHQSIEVTCAQRGLLRTRPLA